MRHQLSQTLNAEQISPTWPCKPPLYCACSFACGAEVFQHLPLCDTAQRCLRCDTNFPEVEAQAAHLYCRRLRSKSSIRSCFKWRCSQAATWLETASRKWKQMLWQHYLLCGVWRINISLWRFYIFAPEGSEPASYTPVLNPLLLLICPYIPLMGGGFT